MHPLPIPAGRQVSSLLRVDLRAPLPPAACARAQEHVRMLLSVGQAQVLVCDVHGTLDLGVVDLLARLALTARRQHVRLVVRAGDDLPGLLRLTGLDRQLETGC